VQSPNTRPLFFRRRGRGGWELWHDVLKGEPTVQKRREGSKRGRIYP